MHAMRLAEDLARLNAGKSNPAKIAMMAMTTSSSINVNARFICFRKSQFESDFAPGQFGCPAQLISSAPLAGLQIQLEFFLERFATAVDKRFRGGKRAVQNHGDFFVAQFVLTAEQDGGALVLRQFGQRLLDFSGEFAVQNIFRGQKNFFVLVLPLWLVVVFGVRFLERFGGMPRAAADFVQA